MILKKTNRTEMVRQLKCILDNCGDASPKLRVIGRNGTRNLISGVRSDGDGAHLCFVDEGGSAILGMAKLFGSGMHEMHADELAEELSRLSDERVWFGWPGSTAAVIGKITAIGSREGTTVYMFPVPEDIEWINEEVRLECAQKCEHAKNGMQCGDCPHILGCDIIREIDERMTNERNK